MATTLDRQGRPVRLGDVVLRTPGLRGTAELQRGFAPGNRGPDTASGVLLEALAEADVREQLTVVLDDLAETDLAGSSRAGGSGSDIELEVPGPGVDFGQFLLYVAEDGTASWHLPNEVRLAPDDADGEVRQTRGAARLSYSIPRAVVPASPAERPSTSRGLGGLIGQKLLKLLVFPLIDPVLGAVTKHVVGAWERKNRPPMVRTFGPDEYTVAGRPLDTAEWARLGSGPALFFVHGTFSQAHTGFGTLPHPLVVELDRRYGGRMFALDHLTMSVDPRVNARALAEAIPPGTRLTVDLLSHSRGGLVGREIAERGTDAGLSGLTVRSHVMVGVPNEGTALAARTNLKAWLDRITNVAQFIPDNPVTDILQVVLTVLKHLALGITGGLEGITAMDPRGDYLRELNASTPTPASARALGTTVYRTIASDFEPAPGSPLGRSIQDAGVDLVFGSAKNDLVVPTDGVATVRGLTAFAPRDRFVFPSTASVDHSSFFANPEVGRKLLEWLRG